MGPRRDTPLALGAAAYIGARVDGRDQRPTGSTHRRARRAAAEWRCGSIDWTPAVRGPLAIVLLIGGVLALLRLAW
jgi:hypothetical protein